MGLFHRLKQLIQPPIEKSKEKSKEKSRLPIDPGDFIEVSLTMYEVVGRTSYPSRKEAVLTIQDGITIRYLWIEERMNPQYVLYAEIDGRMDSYDEVPTTIELEGTTYYMEERYTSLIASKGQTPYPGGGEQLVWQFQSDDTKHLRIEWKDGRYMLYEGSPVIAADVAVLKGTRDPVT